jgi:uncharacterized protein
MRGALQTAAGVAGGALLFEGVRSLFHSGSSGIGGWGGLAGNPWGNPETVVNETTINEPLLDDARDERSDTRPTGASIEGDPGDRDKLDVTDWSDDSSGFDARPTRDRFSGSSCRRASLPAADGCGVGRSARSSFGIA